MCMLCDTAEEQTCDVCGGTGFGRAGLDAVRWTGGRVVHTDPDVCRQHLEECKRKLDEALEKLEGERHV